MKLFGFLIRLVFVVALVVWLADRPGTAQIVWRDTIIETSAAVLAVIIAAIAYAFVLLHRIWRLIIDGPGLWRLKRRIGKMEEGQSELAKGLAAVAAGQACEAGRHAVKARKLLGETPTTRLLLAQSAQLAGDERAAKVIFQAMTQDKDTAVLGYRGLIRAAMRCGHWDEASRLVAQLEETKADVPWLHLVRFELATRLENWQTALSSLALARKGKILPAPLAQGQEAALLLAQAKGALRDSLPDKALELAEKAYKLRLDWAPAALVLAEAQIVTHHERAALRTIERAWNRTQNPQLLPLVSWAMQSAKPIEVYKTIEKMMRDTRDKSESLMALADFAFKASLWGETRRHLMVLVARGDATQATYQLLARLEQRERHDDKAAALWVAKALSAPTDARWLCTACGAAHDDWDASCGSCGAFNRMEWGMVGKGRAQRSVPQLTMLDDLA